MPRKWLPSDPYYGEYQSILFDIADPGEEFALADTDGANLLDDELTTLLEAA